MPDTRRTSSCAWTIEIRGDDRNGRRRHAGNPRRLSKRAWAVLIDSRSTISRERPGTPSKRKLAWDLPLFLAPLALDRRLLAFQIPFVLERGLDAREIEVPDGPSISSVNRPSSTSVSRRTSGCLSARAAGTRSPSGSGDARPLYGVTIAVESIAATVEAVPPLVVHESDGFVRLVSGADPRCRCEGAADAPPAT